MRQWYWRRFRFSYWKRQWSFGLHCSLSREDSWAQLDFGPFGLQVVFYCLDYGA